MVNMSPESADDVQPAVNHTFCIQEEQSIEGQPVVKENRDDSKFRILPGCRQEFRCRDPENQSGSSELPKLIPHLGGSERKCSHLRCWFDRVIFYIRHPFYALWRIGTWAPFLVWLITVLLIANALIGFYVQVISKDTPDPCGATPAGAFRRAWGRTANIGALIIGYLEIIALCYHFYDGDQFSAGASAATRLALVPIAGEPILQGLWAMAASARDDCLVS